MTRNQNDGEKSAERLNRELCRALDKADVQAVIRALDSGADPRHKKAIRVLGCRSKVPVLMQAVLQNNIEIARVLVARGADGASRAEFESQQTRCSMDSMYLASAWHMHEFVELFLSNNEPKSCGILFWSTIGYSLQSFGLNAAIDRMRCIHIPSHLTCPATGEKDQLKTVELLLKAGGDLSAGDVEEEEHAVVECLAEWGKDKRLRKVLEQYAKSG